MRVGVFSSALPLPTRKRCGECERFGGVFCERLCLTRVGVGKLLDVRVLLFVGKVTSVQWCWYAGWFFFECAADADQETLWRV